MKFYDTHQKQNEYDEQTRIFLSNTGSSIIFNTLSDEEKENERKKTDWIFGIPYRVKIRRGNRSFSFIFHDSINNEREGKRPTDYDVLACLQKYDVGTIDDFVSEFGYTFETWEDVKKVQKTYKAVKREYNNVMRLFGDVIDALQEIQ